MDTKKHEALRLADALKNSTGITGADVVASELLRLHAENEALRTGYDAARLEIASLHTQLEAVGAGGMGPLRKRCLHQISEPAHEPLTEEQMHQDLAALCKRIFNARIGKACSSCEGGTYQPDSNGYSQFHRCNKCCYVPMWGEDGSEFGITAAQKGGQHGAK